MDGEPNGVWRPRGSAASRRLTAGVVAGLVLITAAMLPSAGAAPASKASTAVRYTKQTVLVPTKTIKQELLSVSKNGAVYRFKARKGALRRLKVGSVMLLQHIAVRDVTKTARSHKHFVVTTKPATITDLVSNGTLSWDKPIDFADGFGLGGSAVPSIARDDRASSSVPAMFGMVPVAGSSGVTFKGTAHSYKYTVSFKKSGKAVAVAITISKKTPVDVEAKITGTLDNLTTAGNIAVQNGAVANAKMLANHLKGSFKLSYSAKPISQFGLGTAGGIKISLPAELAVPFFVGPVPFFLGINVAFFASAGFSGFNQHLSGSYTINYDGEGGFSSSSEGATTGAGVLKGLGDVVLSAANAVKTGPISFTFGAQMPQIELGLGAKGLNVAGNITLVGSTGIATFGAGCDTRQLEVEGTAGAEASFFGFSAESDPATLFDRKVEAAYPKGCGSFPDNHAVAALLR